MGSTSSASNSELPSIYFAHTRPVVRKGDLLMPVTDLTRPSRDTRSSHVMVRFSHRRRRDCTAPVESDADTVEKILAETAATTTFRTRRHRAWTTRPPKRPWSSARKKATLVGYWRWVIRTGRLLGAPPDHESTITNHQLRRDHSSRITRKPCPHSKTCAEIDNGLLRFLTRQSMTQPAPDRGGRLLLDSKTIRRRHVTPWRKSLCQAWA